MLRGRMRLAVLACGLLAVAVSYAQEQSGSAPATPPAGEAKIATPMRVRVSSGVASKLVRKTVPPHYPDAARHAGIQGSVLLKALISKTGDVVDLQVISGNPPFTEAAMNAVKQWKFKPYLLQGQPVQVETQIQVNFTL